MRTVEDQRTDRSVLHVVHVIHSLGPGGAEDVLVTFSRHAAAAGITMTVVALSPADLTSGHVAELRAAGAQVVELGLGRWDPRAVPRLARLLRRTRVDVVHTHLKHADVVGGLAAVLARVPTVSTLHVIELIADGAVARLKRRVGLRVRRAVAERTIALSGAQREWYESFSRGRAPSLIVLPNGASDPQTTAGDPAPLRRELAVPDGAALAVTASLMRPEKGHHLLLDALERLPGDLGLVVALAGDGPLSEELGARVRADPRLRDRVRLLGYRDDVAALLHAADLVVHPSLEDALPTTLILALGAGRPIVATEVGGIPDIVSPDTGSLVPRDPDALAAAIRRAVTEPQMRREQGEAARRRFREHFDAEVWMSRLRSVYDEVV